MTNAIDDGVSIRPLESSKDFQAFEDLQREVWGQNLSEVVTASLAQITQKIGGIAAGAFSPSGVMLGLVFGFTGFTNGRPVHWSHMLAVKPNRRDAGLGRRLKLYQRDVLLRDGVKEVFWTYDPLVARNAHLNFNTLGVEVSEYVPDMYGAGDDSELFRGIGTDRFIVVWKIDSERVQEILAGKSAEHDRAYDAAAFILERRLAGDSCSEPRTNLVQRSRYLKIEIPPDIHEVRDRSSSIAAEWRKATRDAFQGSLADGYEIGTFNRDEQTGRCFYCLRTKE